MRKRFTFETLHLDLEGGVGERRTTPATSATILDEVNHVGHHHENPSANGQTQLSSGAAKVEVRMENVPQLGTSSDASAPVADPPQKKIKPKKRVAFQSDRPDLYDF